MDNSHHPPPPFPGHAQTDFKLMVILLSQLPSAEIMVLSNCPWLLSFLMGTVIYVEQGCAIAKITQEWKTRPFEEFGCFK